MTTENIILLAYIPLGFVCLFRPMLFLYLFLTLPAFEYVPQAIGDFSTLTLMQVGSINLYVHDYLLLLMAIFFLNQLMVRTHRFLSLLNTPLSRIVMIIFIWEIFINSLSYTKGFSLQNILRNISVVSLLFIAILIPLIDDFDQKKEKLLHFSVFMGILVILFAVLKYYILNEVELTSSDTQRTLAGNAIIILIFPLCYVLYHSRFWRNHGWLSLFFVCLIAIGIHFAGHRSGWIAFFVVTGFWFVFQEDKIQLAWVPFWSVSLVLILLMISLSLNVRSGTAFGDFFIRISDTINLENATTQERLSKWKYSFDTVSRNPFLGLGRIPVYTMHLNEENRLLAKTFSELERAPHNLFADIGVHQGLLGLGMLMIFFYVIFKQFVHVSSENRNYYNFFKVFLLAFFIYSMFNPIFTNQTGKIYLFTILGFINVDRLNMNLSR